MYQSIIVADEKKHSAAHVLAMAVSRMFPEVKIGIGPVTKEGFYYDFDINGEFNNETLESLEKICNEIIQENLPFRQIILPREDAMTLLLQRGQIYKAELIRAIPDTEISFFKTGDDFIELCRGPHVQSTGELGPIKLVDSSFVHWNEDNNRPLLKRITGLTFNNLTEYEEFNKTNEEYKTFNNSKLSNKLGLIYEVKESSFLTNRGTSIYKRIKNILKYNFNLKTQVENLGLESTENLVKLLQDKNYSKIYSETNSLLKINEFNANSNISVKLGEFIDSLNSSFKKIGLDFFLSVTTSDFENEGFVNFTQILQRKMVSHIKVLKSDNKDGIVVQIKNVNKYGREYILGSLDIVMNKNELLNYTFEISNILKCLLEESEGKLNRFLAPVQVEIIAIKKKFNSDVENLFNTLSNKLNNISFELNKKSKSLKTKVKKASELNVPVILFLGEKELTTNSVTVREDGKEFGLIAMDEIDNYLNSYFNIFD